MAKQKAKEVSYESAMTELQQIVTDMQTEKIGIDDLSDKVKRAADLVQFCKTKLRAVEQDISKFLDV